LNARGLRLLTDVLRKMGYEVVPSEANFVMIPLENPSTAQLLVDQLLRRGVIVRPLGAFGLPHCVRISTGTDEENGMLIDALEEIHLKEELCRS
jgi:histidinol-phosphate aminotransferase